MICQQCASASTRPHWGGFDAKCLDCAARVVAKTYPDKQQANVMLAVICRQPGRPDRAAILSRVTQLLGKPD